MNKYQKALTKAREHIASGDHNHICIALLQYPNTKRLLKSISESLDGCNSVKYWLRCQGVPLKDLTPEAMREYRLRWIDKMIEDFA
jgi:hypothetical protein